MMDYRKLFDPAELQAKAPALERQRPEFAAEYEYDDSIVLAVNVALATRRPLLLRGDAGSGKSTLAADVARLLHRRYYEQIISSNTEAADLLWRIDQMSRIADAQAGNVEAAQRPIRYLKPGVLFWAFDPGRARQFDPYDPDRRTWRLASTASRPAVILLDEIDKAEPDFPNDLLGPLGSLSFSLPFSEDPVRAPEEAMRPLVMVTTNEERDLPPAFLRRCVVLRLTVPGREGLGPTRLTAIARRHFDATELDSQSLETVKARYFDLRDAAARAKVRAPGTAEFLDLARAVVELRGKDASGVAAFIDDNDWSFREIASAALWKDRQLPEPKK
jgi:MoxR-like ATPase